MSTRPLARPHASDSAQTAASGYLQRHCSCGARTPGGAPCKQCSGKLHGLQRVLTVGADDDPLEREADRVADDVMSESSVSPVRPSALSIRRIGASAQPRAHAAPPSVEQTLATPGVPLDSATRTSMEQRFAHDFSRVRVHAGQSATQSASEVGARAYVVGNHMVFNAGQLAPGTSEGRRLIAHELTHVVQQTGSGNPRIVARDTNFAPSPAPAAGVTPPNNTRPPPLPEPRTAVSGSQQFSDWEEGTEVQKLGIVAVEDGTNLRPTAQPGSTPIAKLPLNTRLFVNRDQGAGWYQVVLEDGRYGFVAKANVSTDLPDAGSRLYRIQAGESALDLVKKFYKTSSTGWGQDERFFVNVLVYANERHGRLGIFKPNKDDAWDATQTHAGSQIWIPSLAFAIGLKGQISSGSISYDAYTRIADTLYAIGEFIAGGIAFVAGLLHGALESVWDTLVGLVDLVDIVWKMLKSLFTGNLLTDTEGLFSELKNIKVSELAQAGLDWLDKKWNAPGLLARWHFRGWIVGYAIAEIAMLIFSDGILTAVKAAGKIGKFAEIIAKFPKIAKFMEGVKTAAKGVKELEALKVGAKLVHAARDWVVKVLRVPARIIGDLSAEAIERLKKLPTLIQERFADLSDAVKIRLLGCASPCKVDIVAIQKYLTELAVTGGKKLTSAADVVAALPKNMNVTKIRQYLAEYPALMKVIQEAGLTDQDFAKLADFLTPADLRNPKTAYSTFTRYLTQVTPAKTGPHLDEFNRIMKVMVAEDAAQGAALKGPMFEGFVRLHVAEFSGKAFERVTFTTLNGAKRTADRFVAALGELWEFKHQLLDKVPASQVADYLAQIGAKTASGAEIKSINFLFATENAAKLNVHLKPLGVRVFFLKPPGVLTLL
ncbi:DUF4157 domain-containing protein [Massilia aurea]|uniref:eCIS core domain-containing protein n=1 Tax=Massilia aurea TaxID=373040 RepID=UPI003463278C